MLLRLRWTALVAAGASVVMGMTAFGPSVSDAQPAEPAPEIGETQIEFGKTIFQIKANCIFCHGWSGDGQGTERAETPGLSLRESLLARDQLITVIQCGRPSTRMPYHDAFAYTDDRCYGLTAEQLGDQVPQRTIESTLQRREIEAVADYLIARVIGRGDIMLEECEVFWGVGAGACDQYR